MGKETDTMKLRIGENIKSLRKAADITQETLAEMLGVSCQSVSRWELGVCYPDMELLPALAQIFHCSTDSLLGMEDSVEKAKTAQYLDRFQAAINKGQIDDCISIAREGVAELPNNYALLNKLMYALFVSGDEDGNIPEWKENMEKYDEEIVALGERIRKYCPDQNIRLEATARLAFQHMEMGRKAIGRSIYETLPPKKFCRENQIWWGLEEAEKEPFLRKEILRDYESLSGNIWTLSNLNSIPARDSIKMIEKIFALDQLIYDGNPPQDDWGAARMRCDLAKMYAKLGQRQLMYRHLRAAAQAAEAFELRPEIQKRASLLLGTVEENSIEYETDDSRPLTEIMRDKWLSDSSFDPYREEEEFREIINSLTIERNPLIPENRIQPNSVILPEFDERTSV